MRQGHLRGSLALTQTPQNIDDRLDAQSQRLVRHRRLMS